MLSFLQSVTTSHPQRNPHDVASLQWQKQHYRNNRYGALIQRLADAQAPAFEARKPFTLRLEGIHSPHIGPYHVVPLWDGNALTLEISNERSYTADSPAIATVTIPGYHIAQDCADYNAPDATPNHRVRNKMNGASLLRDRLMEHGITPSDSFAAALFETIAGLTLVRPECDA